MKRVDIEQLDDDFWGSPVEVKRAVVAELRALRRLEVAARKMDAARRELLRALKVLE